MQAAREPCIVSLVLKYGVGTTVNHTLYIIPLDL
jgi:hypothetical protein